MIRAAVLGKPIDHSLSPLVHGLIYKELDIEYDYRRIEADEVQARALIEHSLADSDEKWSGFSLTMPLKEVGFSLDLPIDARALAAHSINTITPKGSFNTDISGFERVMKVEGVNSDSVILLGNGATARSVLIALEAIGLTTSIAIYRRNPSRDQLLPTSGRVSIKVKMIEELPDARLNERQLVISTLPASSQGLVSAHLVGFSGTLIDFSYAPWPSVLAGIASGRVISGLPILVAQAVDQAVLFSGVDFDRDEMYRSVLLSTARSIAATE